MTMFDSVGMFPPAPLRDVGGVSATDLARIKANSDARDDERRVDKCIRQLRSYALNKKLPLPLRLHCALALIETANDEVEDSHAD